jgi:hypothetical protein
MASNDRPVFFISSSMSELAEERQIVRKAVAKFADGTFETFCFEEDAVAQGGSPQDVWREQLERTDTTIGLLGQYTEEELRISRERGIPILLFRKKDKQQVLERDAAEFIGWLEDAEDGITAKYFKTPKQLKQYVKDALARQQKELFGVARGARRSGTISVDGAEIVEEAAPKIRRRREPPSQLRPQRLLVGRDRETARLLAAIDRARDADKRLIVLVGPDGIGKRALLRFVTHSGDLEPFPDGTAVHPDWKEREDLEDLRQALWEEFYDTQHVVDPRGRDRQLREIEALVFLPAVDGSAEIVDLVDETMPRSVFCTSRREVTSPVIPVKLAGLTEDADLLAVFEHHYGAVPDPARAAVVALCRSTDGNPAKIELLATEAMMDAPDDGDPESADRLAAWAADAARGPDIAPEEQRVLTVVRDVGDVHTPREVLADVAGSVEPVDRALDRGHLRSASPRYRLNPVLEPATDDAAPSAMPEVFASTLRWVDGASHAEIFANRTFVLRMLSWGIEQERWEGVIALGRRAEPSFAMGGRHGAWRELLGYVEVAARRVDPVDEGTLGWALHQLGSRSLLRDELGDGRARLFEAFRLRHDDEDARELTRTNLKLLPAALIPWYVLVAVMLVLALALVALLLPDDRRLDLDVDFGRVTIPVPVQIAATGGLERSGDDEELVTVSIDEVTVDGVAIPVEDAGFCFVGDGLCADETRSGGGSVSVTGGDLCRVTADDGAQRSVEPGQPCFIDIAFDPPTFGRFEGRLTLVADDGSEYDGTVAATVTAAIAEVDPDFHQFFGVGEAQSFTVTNVGNVAIEVGEAVLAPVRGDPGGVDPAEVFTVDVACPTRLEPGDRCSVEVTAVQAGSGFLEIGLTAVDDTAPRVLGDTRVLLVGP